MEIKIVTPETYDYFRPLLWQAGAIRKRLCIDVLKWPGRSVLYGMEHDEFDEPDIKACHILVCDDDGKVVGVNRLVPTEYGNYMLKHIWPYLVEKVPLPQSPEIWEQSRFCIDPLLAKEDRGKAIGGLALGGRVFNQSRNIKEIWWMAWPENIRFLGENVDFLGEERDVDGWQSVAGRSFPEAGGLEHLMRKLGPVAIDWGLPEAIPALPRFGERVAA